MVPIFVEGGSPVDFPTGSLQFLERAEGDGREIRQWKLIEQFANRLGVDGVDRLEFVVERAVLTEIGPVAADAEHAAVGAFAGANFARGEFGPGHL